MSQDPNMYNAPYPPQQPGGYGQSQMPFQPPPVLPRPDFPKG